jgi:excinuclease ABC subunit A
MDAPHSTPDSNPPPSDGHTGFVSVRGAREHNLKNIDVRIPRDALVVFTGVSGSGKSSLAFGTLYAEAQRRYFESVAPYARRLIEQVGVPEVDAIEGLPPAVALQQQRGAPSARSSVGSVTTLSSLVRMLYSRTGDYPPKQPMLFAEDFSPNTVQGACPTCHGLGRVYEVTEKSMVPDDSLTIRERAIAAWPPAWHGQNLRDILVTLGYDVDTPWRDLPKKDRDWILFTDEQPTVPVYAGLTAKETRAALRRKDEPSYQGTFTGARRYVLHTFANTQSALMKKRVSQYMLSSECPACHGKRLKKEALSVKFAGFDIGEFSQLPLAGLAAILEPIARGEWPEPDKGTTGDSGVLSRSAMRDAVDRRVAAGGSAHKASPDVRRTPNLSGEKRLAAQRIAAELLERLSTLVELGLGYLALERSTPTLSSGELQRLRLATQLSSQLFGVVYVLDEPSAGLHPADGEALFSALQALKAAGNSLFVVEHDLQMMRRADWLVDVGPAAGEAGGHVVYSGPPAGLAAVEASQTRRHLFAPPAQIERTPRDAAGWLRLVNITRSNLRGLNVALPLNCLTTVTGVSGSGKSSLVSQALPELVARGLGKIAESPDDDEQDPLLAIATAPTGGQIADGMDALRRLVRVDQKPIGRHAAFQPRHLHGAF